MKFRELLATAVGHGAKKFGRRLVGGALLLAAGSAFAASNLVVNQTDNPDPGAAGENFSYRVEVTNSGPDTATVYSNP